MNKRFIRKIRKQLLLYEVTKCHYSRLFGIFYKDQKPTIILARNHNEAIQRFLKRYDRSNYIKGLGRRETTESWATWKVKQVDKSSVYTKYY